MAPAGLATAPWLPSHSKPVWTSAPASSSTCCRSSLRRLPNKPTPAKQRWLHHTRHSPALVTRAADAASASFASQPQEDPYKVLGLSPLDPFDQVKKAHRKKVKEAQERGDDAYLEQVDKAYDMIMMQQLSRRKMGVTFGSVQVSQEVKYADTKDWIPWRPRYERSPKKRIMLNAALSTLMALWSLAAPLTDWKVLQILLSYYVFILFLKLDPFYPPGPEDEEKPWARNGRRLIRALGLVFGCVAASTLAYTLVYHSFSLLGFYIPRALITFQETLITLASSLGMFYIGSYYR